MSHIILTHRVLTGGLATGAIVVAGSAGAAAGAAAGATVMTAGAIALEIFASLATIGMCVGWIAEERYTNF